MMWFLSPGSIEAVYATAAQIAPRIWVYATHRRSHIVHLFLSIHYYFKTVAAYLPFRRVAILSTVQLKTSVLKW
jgi:uncharacterized membrane protein YhfC